MRLIDADTLKAEFTGNFQDKWHYTGIRAIIDVAPTIEAVPVVHGHWVEMNRAYYYKCSVCRTQIPYTHGRKLYNDCIENKKYYLYCPHCGAKMDEESEKE